MFKAAIFDLDGTLVDSLRLHLLAFMKVCNKHGIPVEEQFVIDRFGMTVQEIFSDLLSAANMQRDLDRLAEEKSAEFSRHAHRIPPLPGALTLLSELKGRNILLGLATGNKHEDMNMIVRHAKLPEFGAYVGAEDVLHGKPAPDVFLKAAEKLSAIPEDCVVFEDAVMGIRAAKNAGMKAVAVLTGLAKQEALEAEMPDLLVDSLSEVTFNKIEGLFL